MRLFNRFTTTQWEIKRNYNMRPSGQTEIRRLSHSLPIGLIVEENETNLGKCFENTVQNVIFRSSRTEGDSSSKLHLMQKHTSPINKAENLHVTLMRMESIISDLKSKLESALQSVQRSNSDMKNYMEGSLNPFVQTWIPCGKACVLCNPPNLGSEGILCLIEKDNIEKLPPATYHLPDYQLQIDK